MDASRLALRRILLDREGTGVTIEHGYPVHLHFVVFTVLRRRGPANHPRVIHSLRRLPRRGTAQVPCTTSSIQRLFYYLAKILNILHVSIVCRSALLLRMAATLVALDFRMPISSSTLKLPWCHFPLAPRGNPATSTVFTPG